MIVLDQDVHKAKREASQPSKPLPNVVTSFNEEGFKKYGQRFIETWQEFWSPKVRLTIYYEGEDFPFTSGMSWVPIEEVEFLTDFMEMLKFPIQHGIVGDSYDVWFDARHCRKPFMQVHALKKYGGKVFWLDADSITHAHVPETFLDECLPDDKLACHLGRDGWYFTESGFLGINGAHPLAVKFINNYVKYFLSGTFLTNAIHGRLCWNDCGGFDAIRTVVFKNHPDIFINLAAGVPQGHMHPFQITAPGKYMNHYKGNRKDTQQLRPEDTVR